MMLNKPWFPQPWNGDCRIRWASLLPARRGGERYFQSELPNQLTQPMSLTFQAELELLIRARYPILYIISSEEMRAQKVVMDIGRKTSEKSFRMELQHRDSSGRHIHPVAENPQPVDQ